ncbi:sacsin-like [Mercenaria mercenaria]|uniref:sacsin-like n=1 Tax=Mercenaria mercenaria TaxID=6596 RepID=UPI00234F85D3|nr:sacsin-like [Mercenaria mercenaria]
MVNCASDKVVHMFKWNIAPKMDIVLQQLTFICQHYNVQNKPDYMRAVKKIYKHLNQFRDEVAKFQNTLGNNAMVWTGSDFELPRKVIITKREQDLDLTPYYCNLPEEIRDMDDLFLQLGCHPEENSDILLNVLQSIKLKYESSTESTESSLSRDLDIVLEILKVLASRRRDGTLDINESRLLMLVDSQSLGKLSLQYIPDCIFDGDQDELDQEEQKIFHIVNEVVPEHIARELGVKSVKRKTILGATEEFSFEECGQHESLTTRINTLLKDGYKDGLSVPKEVVQNADDAGATVVKFLYDERHNNDAKRKEKLFSSYLKECQGPALWVYNDSQFTEKDLENITKLNGATKADDLDKIGKFGLGFCSVYNLTDVPSFISGKDMVIFDPHETYLEEARQTRGTGLRVRLSKRNLIRRHFDQFKPYNAIFGCNVLEANFTDFSGTLFRLPLRTENQATKSKICDEAYTKEEVSSLLSKLVENAGNLILFTQNVKTLQIYYLSKDETDPSRAKLLFNINKEIEQNAHDETARYTQSILKRIPTILKSNKDFSEIQHIQISQKLFENSFLKSTSKVSNSVSVETKWIVSWALGKNESLRLSKRISEKGAVPLSAVAVPMRDKADTIPLMLDDVPIGFYKKGHLFCFLPLPITTSLPVYVNGCFSVTSDRRGLSCLTEDDKKKGDNYIWNEALMEDSLVQSYVELLLFLSRKCSDSYSYHSLWPSVGSDDVQVFKRSFYKTLILDKPKLFRGAQAWLSADEVVFLDPAIRCNDIIGETAFKFVSAVPIRPGRNVVEIPHHVLIALQDCKCDSKTIISEAMIKEEELILHFLTTLDSVDWQHQLEERNKLILYALNMESEKVFTKLHKTRCIPSEPNNVLCRPNELINPKSDIADMFAVADGRFPLKAGGFCESKVIVQLINLGMNDKFLPNDMLLQKCKSIEELCTVCGSCAQQRCVRILKYCGKWEVIKYLEKDIDTLNKLKHKLLLPVLPSPSGWKFSWKGNSLEEHTSNANCENHQYDVETCVRFEKPIHLFREPFHNCIGSVSSFVNEKYLKKKYSMPERLFIALGVKRVLTVELLLQQLTLLSDQYVSSEKQFSNLEAISKSVYEWLGQLTGDKSEEEISKMQCFLNSRQKALIVIGKELVMPCKVAFQVKMECSPELYCLREFDFKKKKVFKALGVKDMFSVDYLLSVLLRLYKTFSQHICTDIDLATSLLLNLCESMKLEGVTYNDLKDSAANIVAPDSDGVLRPTSELVIEDPAYKSSADLHILHGNIPPDTGRALGVKSKQRKIVEFFSSGFFVPFGQNESLVTRLTGILQDYPCDSSIMKELIQNADDAGATEIYFIKNYASHSTEKIFGKEGLQGPSLCIFNDSYFTEEDFHGIRNLGIGSKREDPFKTGQYGIGFNAVYHLTDVPSFLTKGPGLGKGGQLCIFDPLMEYLEGHVTNENPGIKCDAELMEESFPDMLHGYPVISNIETSGQGTIFRLPLRQSRSDISNNVVSVERMDELIETFKNDMFESLLFLKSIKSIKVLNNTNGKLIEEFAVGTKLSEKDDITRKEYFSSVKEVVQANIDVRHLNLCMQPIESSYRIEIEDTTGRKERWLIVNRFGMKRTDEKYSAVISALKEKDIGLMPVASVALLWPKDDWKNCLDRKSSQTRNKEDTRNVFCFLPLPLLTGLPLHVNSHFALDKARTKLWNEGIRKCWNEFVIEELLSRTYISAIQYFKKEFVSKHLHMLDKKVWPAAFEKYHEHFPHWEKATDSFWKSLVGNFYRIVIGEEFEVFPSVRAASVHNGSDRPPGDVQEHQLDWVSLSKSENDFKGTFNVIRPGKSFYLEYAKSVETTVKKMGMKVIETPLWVSNSIRTSGIEYIPACTPESVIKFIKTFADGNESVCQLGGINVPLAETAISDLTALQSMLWYVIKDKLFKEKVEGLPLCLANNGVLQIFNKHAPKFCSDMCDGLTGSADQFIHSQLVHLVDRREYHEAGVIKYFEVTDLVSHLANTFDPTILATGSHVIWNKQSGIPIKPDILRKIFQFIYDKSLHADTKQINHDVFQSNVRKLDTWSLMPSCHGYGSKSTFEIVPVCQTSHLFHRSFGNDDLCKIIEKFNIPHLDTSAFLENGKHLTYALQKLLPSTELPVELLECLFYYRKRIQASALTREESITVLSYFNDKINQMKKKLNEIDLRNMFKSLPLYVSHQGEILSIEGYSDIVVLPFGIPKAGIQVWAQSTGILLLTDTEKLLKLYQLLQLPRKTELEVYVKKILPSFHKLPRNTWITHIKYMKKNLLRTSFQEQLDEKQCFLVEQLKSLAFVRHLETDRRVNELYDHNHPVFCCMLGEDSFLPQEYRGYSWTKFMELLGLIKEPTDEMLISFVHILEAKINNPINDVTIKQSMALIDCLFNGQWTEQTLTGIKGVRFVVPYKVDLERLNIASQPGNGDILICLSGAVSYVHADYCWSSLNLLLRVPTSADMLKSLGIYEYPPIDSVVQHCQNVTGVFEKDLDKQIPSVLPCFVKKQMELLYEALLKHFHPTMQQKFQATPLVFHPEDKKMLQVKQIVINLTEDEEVRPFLYKLPNCFGPFEELFVKLGSHDRVLCSHYSMVLETIKGQFGNEPLPPNQLLCVKRALENIVKRIEPESNPLQDVNSLYIPNRNQVLVSSKSLTVSNNADVEERLDGKIEIQFFLGFREMDIAFVSDPVLPFLKCPEDLKPDILTEVVKEQVLINAIERKESLLAQRIEVSFRSPLFVEGILRLVKHQMKLNGRNFSRDIEKSFMLSLTNIKISKVSGLKTFLTYKGNKVDSTDRIASCFIQSRAVTQDDDETKEHELFFQMDAEHDLLVQLIEEENGLVKLIDTCTEEILEKQLSQHIPSILRLLEKPSEIKQKLDRLRIDAYDLPQALTISVFPRPGTYVEDKFHPFLEQSISPIKTHEFMYVALEIEDEDDSGDPVYIYAHITSENMRGPEQSVLSITYKVDVGYRSDGFVTVPIYRLYRFKPKQPEEINALEHYDIETIGSIPIDENFRLVRQMLIDGWSLNATERKRIIRRCLTRWHPDRNMDHREYAERLFNYINEIVVKLENNEIINNTITHDTGRMPPDMSLSSFASASSAAYNRGCRYAAAFHNNMRDYNRSTRTGIFAHHKAEEAVVRHVGEAKRWHRQAVQDIKAAESNVNTGEQDQSFNWVCYKCHQASEKALKAAWFAKDANRVTTREHSLTAIANCLDDGAFLVEASSLEGITGDCSCMQYPDPVAGLHQIPSEIFDRTKAKQAIKVTKRILEMASDFIA